LTANLQPVAEGIVRLAGEMLELVRAPETSEVETSSKLGRIKSIEEEIDTAFESAATRIMGLEVFPVNPDYFLQVAKGLDRTSDLIERTSLLLEWRHKLSNEESELLESAASQVAQLAENISLCLKKLGRDHGSVEEICGVIIEREKAVDQIRNHFNRVSSRKGYDIEKRLWLTEVLHNMDTMADEARDLTITLRVISNKLEKQRRLDVKSGLLR
jgi:uncharacterized protein Yka (UPF0111/DUF47 family)